MANDSSMKDPHRAFSAGDYVTAARHAQDNELRGAALVLLGAFDEGLPLIENATSARGFFAAAVALWAGGNAAAARANLQRIIGDSEFGLAAQRLDRIVTAGKVKILIHGRDDPTYPSQDVVGGLRRSPIAEIVSIGFGSRADIPFGPEDSLEDISVGLPEGWLPDLFLASWLEDHPPPRGIHAAPYPTFYSAIDFDRHLHHCQPWFGQFDAAIATSGVDHEALAGATHGQAFTCPFPYGMEKFAEPEANTERPVDLVVSGTLFNHSDAKSACMFDISQLPERFEVEMYDRLDRAAYLASLRRSKFTVAHLHRPGVLSSRAFEALSQGCCVLYQEESDLGLFFGPEDGAIPYGQGNFVAKACEAIEAHPEQFARAAVNGAAKARRLFELDSCMTRYAAVLAAYAALCGTRRRPPPNPSGEIWRPNRSPQRILYQFDTDAAKVFEFHDRFQRSLPPSNDYVVRDAMGEAYLYRHLFERQLGQMTLEEYRARADSSGSPLVARQADAFEQELADRPPGGALRQSKEIYEALSTEYPDRLAAIFNLGRVAIEGRWTDTAETAFCRILDRPELRYEATDLLFWREFHDGFFDYDRFMQAILGCLAQDKTSALMQIAGMIRESAAFYLLRHYAETGRHHDQQVLIDSLKSNRLYLAALRILIAECRAVVGDPETAMKMLGDLFVEAPWTIGPHGRQIKSILQTHNLRLPDIEQALTRLQERHRT